MQVWWPTGRFVLPDIEEKKIVFIGTGTGFAPLYFQAKSILEKTLSASVIFIFWVREEKDLFYQEVLQKWSDTYPNFSYQFCLSQWKEDTYFQWRVTNYLRNNAKLIDKNTLYSVCGSPSMVTEVRAILTSHDIEKDSVFFEQY
jgi:ferredoxin-NADP reductase